MSTKTRVQTVRYRREDVIAHEKMMRWCAWAGESQNDFTVAAVRAAIKQLERDQPELAEMIDRAARGRHVSD